MPEFPSFAQRLRAGIRELLQLAPIDPDLPCVLMPCATSLGADVFPPPSGTVKRGDLGRVHENQDRADPNNWYLETPR
jgi:hypothetical protein